MACRAGVDETSRSDNNALVCTVCAGRGGGRAAGVGGGGIDDSFSGLGPVGSGFPRRKHYVQREHEVVFFSVLCFVRIVCVFCLFVSFGLSVGLFVRLFVCLFVHLFVRLLVCLACLFVYFLVFIPCVLPARAFCAKGGRTEGVATCLSLQAEASTDCNLYRQYECHVYSTMKYYGRQQQK